MHRNLLLDVTKAKNINLFPLSDILNFLQKDTCLKDLMTEVVKLIHVLFIVTVTSCTEKRSFSSLWQLKTFLRSTMTQTRLNDLAIIYVHKKETHDIDEIANQLINVSTGKINL